MSLSTNIQPDNVEDSFPAARRLNVHLRSYSTNDRHHVRYLYDHGLLTGQLDALDPATDLDHIVEIYLQRPQDHFWVAEVDGKVIGSIALLGDAQQIAHIRRLRVDPAWQARHADEVALALIQTATQHARHHDYVKIVLHTPVDDARAISFLTTLGFQHARTRELRGRHLLEFYLNLYARPDGTGNDERAHGEQS